jgi:hypothetical protein
MPESTEPTPARYQINRTPTPLPIDGKLTHPAWEAAPWTEDFIDILGSTAPVPRFRTRVKLLWDDECLYVGAHLEEPNVWATLTEQNSRLTEENNFEVFIDPDGDGENYYEFETNCLGTRWELTMPKRYTLGGEPINPTNLPGLRHAIHVDGTANNPSDVDRGWSVEIAFPWTDLTSYHPDGAVPPAVGDEWRMNFMRIEWPHEVIDGAYKRGPAEDFWVWSPQYQVDMHQPEYWGFVEFR